MSEGRNELEQALDVWERRHAAAVRAKREAEVVIPFMRAAIEELDSFNANGGSDETAEIPVVAKAPVVAEEPEAESSDFVDNTPDAPMPFSIGAAGAEEADEADDADDSADEDSDEAEAPAAFNPRRGIAALLSNDSDEDEDEAAAG